MFSRRIHFGRIMAPKLAAVGLAFSLLLAVGPGADAAQSIAPKELKQRALDTLQPYLAESNLLNLAADAILQSLDPALWVDDSHLDPEEGEDVFDLERDAVKYLQRAIGISENSEGGKVLSSEAADAARSAIADLVDADRLLAKLRFQEAQGTRASDSKRQSQVDRELDKAGEEQAEGNANRDAGKPDKAIKRYRKAWKHAGRGLKHQLPVKVGFDLARLLEDYEDYVVGREDGQGFVPAKGFLPVIGGGVVIDAVAQGDPQALQAALEKLGLQNSARFGRMVSGVLPIGAIEQLVGLGQLQSIRPAYAATVTGSVLSQGDAAMRSDDARTTYFVDGTGITVGVMSDSFDCLNGAAGDVTSGDLPAGIVVLDELGPPCNGTDEGRAMMQLIHDVAPGASQKFHTAFEGQASFAQGIKDLEGAGAKVIVDDVIYFAEPMFQDGIIAQAVDQVKALGAAYFSSAGNAGRLAYESASFAPVTGTGSFTSYDMHDFDPGAGVDNFQSITIPVGVRVTVVLQWDQPALESELGFPPSPGSGNDIDLFLLNSSASSVLASANNFNVGVDPVEVLSFTNSGPSTQFNMAIGHYLPEGGTTPGRVKYVVFGGIFVSGQAVFINQFDTASGTVYGHANAAGAEAVGAAFYGDTPEFGTIPPVLEAFSSGGATPILFNTSGASISPVVRGKPEIVAPDGANTTFFGTDIAFDADAFPNFFGTSAAAPHAAAVSALMLEAKPGMDPAGVYDTLEASAIDMNAAGFDFDSGFGLIQADVAVGNVVSVPAAASAATATETTINVTFTEDLNGATVVDTEFTVSGNTVVSASETAPGIVTLTVGTPLATDATPTVTYTQGSLADIPGNLVATFTEVAADGVGPALDTNGTTSATTIALGFTEDLDGATVSAGDFSVSGNTVIAASETAPGVVTLTVDSPIPTDASVIVTYTPGALADLLGNLAAGFSNATIDLSPPVVLSITTRATTTIEVAFSEDLNGATVLAANFSVAASTVTGAAETSAGIVTLTLDTAIATGGTPLVTYTQGALADSSGNLAAGFSIAAADGIAPALVSAVTKTPVTIDLAFTEPLSGGSVFPSQFSVASNTVIGAVQGTAGIVTLTVGTPMSTSATPDVVYSQGTLADPSANLVPGFVTQTTDGMGPELLSITWKDLGALTVFDPGDTLSFGFSESMATTTVTSANVNAAMPPLGGSYGTLPTTTWSADGVTLKVTLSSGATGITTATTVNPTSAVTDIRGNSDATPGIGPTLTPELVALSLAAAPLSVVRGQEVLVAVNTGEVDGLKTATYQVSFDTPVLRLEGVTAGTVGGTSIPVVAATTTVTGGGVSSFATIVQNVTNGATGSGVLASLRFTFIGNSGEASGIALSNVDLRDLAANPIALTWSNTSVLSPLVVGDASGDGALNVLDVTAIERIVAKVWPPTPGADANLSGGEINAVDITGVERLVLGLPVATSGAGNQSPPPVLVTVEAPAGVKQGVIFAARVNTAAMENFDSASFDLAYDPDVLAIDNISPGVGITNGNVAGWAVPVVETNETAPGTVRVVLNVPGFPGVSGVGFLAEVHFRAVGSAGSSTTISLANLILSDNTAREIPSASLAATVVLTGNRPPVAYAAFEPIDVEESSGTFRVLASAEDPDGNLDRVVAVIETPSTVGLEISRKVDDRVQVKFDFRKNKLEIKGPVPQDILDQIETLGGILVADGQKIKVELKTDTNREEFKFGRDGTLEVTAAQVTLRVTAVDTGGESDTATANPAYPTGEDPKRSEGRRGKDSEETDGRDDDAGPDDGEGVDGSDDKGGKK